MSDLQSVQIRHALTGKYLIISGQTQNITNEVMDVSAFVLESRAKIRGVWQWNKTPNTGELHGFLNTYSNGRLWIGGLDEDALARKAVTKNHGDGSIDGLSIVVEPQENGLYLLKWNSNQVEWDKFGHTGDGYLFVSNSDSLLAESKVFWARKEDHPADADSFLFEIKPIS